MNRSETKVRIPLLPPYSYVKDLLKVYEDTPKATVYGMMQSIWEQTGTPQDPVDWSNPDSWIDERLEGEQAAFARRLWEESAHTINPRHIHGSYLFINKYDLARPDEDGLFQITRQGQEFLKGTSGIVRAIDESEGLIKLLQIMVPKPAVRRGDLLEEWGDFLRKYSNFGTDSTIKDTLRRRLKNLVERKYVRREGNKYCITPYGIKYAGKASDSAQQELVRAINIYNSKRREALRERLSKMDPHRFEVLVAELLEAMGYEDPTVTKASGDKGVDVVATIQFGITTITEFVQVKRHQSNIQRSVLDQLRGSLPYHKAIRGTIITLGDFSSGCKEAALFPGAAPITLINGEKLLDLLIENQIGVRTRPLDMYDIDEEFFEQAGPNEELPKTDDIL